MVDMLTEVMVLVDTPEVQELAVVSQLKLIYEGQ